MRRLPRLQLPGVPQHIIQNYALGNERFGEEIAQALGRHVTRGKAGRPPKVVESESRAQRGENVRKF